MIFEQVMRSHLVKLFEENSLLLDIQHGFQKNRSCLSKLIEHVEKTSKNLNEGEEIIVNYLDYIKAFDKLDQKVLLAKMNRYAANGKVYD